MLRDLPVLSMKTVAGRIAAERLADHAFYPASVTEALDIAGTIEAGAIGVQVARDLRIAGLLTEYHHVLQAYDDDARVLVDLLGEFERYAKDVALSLGESIERPSASVIFTAGTPVWDDAALLAYAANHPEVMAFRSVSEPIVSVVYSK